LLRWRLILGAAFTAAFAGIGWLDHVVQPRGLFLGPLAVVLCVLATAEALFLMRAAGAMPSVWATYCGALIPVTTIAATPYLVLLTGTEDLRPASMLVPALLAGVVIAAVAAIARFDGTPQCAIDFAATSFVATYIGGSLASLAMLRHYTIANYDLGLILLMATVAVVKAGDIGAYTVGRLIGRRKLAPRLSPGKTWEGALGAIAFSCLAGVALLAIGSRQNWFVATSVVQVVKWLLFGVALSVAGMVGDLAESLLKRSAGVKDSSTWMPGFGGVLDVLDSLLLAGPVSLGFVLAGMIQA
jgi:phosphatidate cytidylyltransferase